jgi:hypothetical protein
MQVRFSSNFNFSADEIRQRLLELTIRILVPSGVPSLPFAAPSPEDLLFAV